MPNEKGWHHGSVCWLGLTVWVKQDRQGWFAAIDPDLNTELKVTVRSGPWETQKEAENKLCDWLTALVERDKEG
jgi:hypothetical protein